MCLRNIGSHVRETTRWHNAENHKVNFHCVKISIHILFSVLCGCKTWPLTVVEEYRLKVLGSTETCDGSGIPLQQEGVIKRFKIVFLKSGLCSVSYEVAAA
jgi:hypothetical protein